MKTPKKRSHTPATKKRRHSRTIGGYSTVNHLGTLAGVIGVTGCLIAGGLLLLKPEPLMRGPLASFSHTTDSPDTPDLLEQINRARLLRKIPQLTLDARLTKVAEDRLKDMVEHQYYSHQDLSGRYYYDLFASQGFSADYSCENLEITTSLNTKKYIEDWLESKEGHRECVLSNKASRVGLATGVFSRSKDKGRTNTTYLVVAIFAQPRR